MGAVGSVFKTIGKIAAPVAFVATKALKPLVKPLASAVGIKNNPFKGNSGGLSDEQVGALDALSSSFEDSEITEQGKVELRESFKTLRSTEGLEDEDRFAELTGGFQTELDAALSGEGLEGSRKDRESLVKSLKDRPGSRQTRGSLLTQGSGSLLG